MDVCHLFYDVLDLAEAKNDQKNSLSNVNVHSNLYKHKKVCSAACNKKMYWLYDYRMFDYEPYEKILVKIILWFYNSNCLR